MEENTVRTNEIEEYEQPEIEVEETFEEDPGSGAIVAGIVGGLLAFAAIGGVKKLAAFAQAKWAERKQKEQSKTVIDAACTGTQVEREDSEKETSEEK